MFSLSKRREMYRRALFANSISLKFDHSTRVAAVASYEQVFIVDGHVTSTLEPETYLEWSLLAK